jgi:hypothetical protein
LFAFVEIFIDSGDVPSNIKISMWLWNFRVCEVITVDPLMVLEELVRHHADVGLHEGGIGRFDSFEIFVKDDVVLGTNKLSLWVEDEGDVAGMVLGLPNIDPHVATSARELLDGFSILKFFH